MNQPLKEQVRRQYARAAQTVLSQASDGGRSTSCCGSTASALNVDLTHRAYSATELNELPEGAVKASLGCGNPVALAALSPGEIVLDLGSGGGIDVLLSARRVSPGGKAYGLDMTDEMLALARANQRQAGVENAEFLKGEIEAIPLPGDHVDVVISNCVINLSTDKARALGEAFRVLKPGGRLALSDMVFLSDKTTLPPDVLHQAELWAGCIAGALEPSEYEARLAAAGFRDISIEVVHTYTPDELTQSSCCQAPGSLAGVAIGSAFIRARKPGGRK